LYETKDLNDNILQQMFYNEETGEYLLREYTYVHTGSFWECTNQRTAVVFNKGSSDTVLPSPTLKIYYSSDLADGPITLLDNEWVKVSIVKYLAKDSWWEFGYELKIVNKTNRVITITIDNESIMDINCKPVFSVDHIDAGDTAYFTLAWDKDTLERCYIPYVDNVEFMVRIFNNDNWKVPALAGERVLIKH
jgi:hypothetical protein